MDTILMLRKQNEETNYQEKLMIEQSLLLKLSSPGLADNMTSHLRQEYQAYQRLFQAQTALVQQYLGIQAASLAEAVIQGVSQVHFTLPDTVDCGLISDGSIDEENIPVGTREQIVRKRWIHFAHPDLRAALCQLFTELEQSSNRAISVSAGLLRYAVATHMIYNMLPSGRSVIYESVDSDDIPNQPVEQDSDSGFVINSSIDAQGWLSQPEKGRGELLVPYVEAARRFYLPQWVAFDTHGKLLLGSVSEAEAHIASMQHYLSILHSAIAIAPYMIADEICQQKRYGMLGQLVNQGRALAHYQSQEIIQTIQQRVGEHRLDRGLRLSLPYFDDQKLLIENHKFVVIPAGRVMFIPAFAVLAAREQQIKVAENNHQSFSTRKNLIVELRALELAFTKR
jgi:hypothetical protein